MAKKSLFDSIDVPTPCPQSWDGMIGDDKTRFCGSCEKNIYNISEMSRSEVRKLLFQSKEKVCIRLEKDADGRVRTLKKQFHKITRQAPIAAGVLSASLTFSALTYAQGDAVIGTTAATISNKQTDKTSKASISGIISDQSGAVIPNATITLRDTKTNLTQNTKSNDEGFYEFESVGKTSFEIVVKAVGFYSCVYDDILVRDDENLQLNITLKTGEQTDGDLIVDEPTETTEPSHISNTIVRRKIESLPAQRQNLPVLGTFPGVRLATAKSPANNRQNKTSQISFTIHDVTGAIVPNQTVKLTNQKTKEEFTVLTDAQGIAQFSLIPRGKYNLNVSGNNFNSHEQIVEIKETIEPNIKITLSVGSFTGVVSISWSEIPLFQAISQEDNDAVKQIINAGFDVNTKDSYDKTALHVAVEHSNLEIVRFLLDHNAKVNIKSKDKRTPLLMIDESVRDEDDKFVAEIVRLLISKGTDVNVQDDEKETALMMAGSEGNLEVTKILLEAGANPNLKDKDGDTVFSMTSYEEIKQLLKQYNGKE